MSKCSDPYPFGDCLICRDKATGIHYGVAACQGCKGFFKRSIMRMAKYVCFTGGSCLMTPQTRSRCKSCRYRRCLDAGMSMTSIKMGRIPKAQKEMALKMRSGSFTEDLDQDQASSMPQPLDRPSHHLPDDTERMEASGDYRQQYSGQYEELSITQRANNDHDNDGDTVTGDESSEKITAIPKKMEKMLPRKDQELSSHHHTPDYYSTKRHRDPHTADRFYQSWNHKPSGQNDIVRDHHEQSNNDCHTDNDSSNRDSSRNDKYPNNNGHGTSFTQNPLDVLQVLPSHQPPLGAHSGKEEDIMPPAMLSSHLAVEHQPPYPHHQHPYPHHQHPYPHRHPAYPHCHPAYPHRHPSQSGMATKGQSSSASSVDVKLPLLALDSPVLSSYTTHPHHPPVSLLPSPNSPPPPPNSHLPPPIPHFPPPNSLLPPSDLHLPPPNSHLPPAKSLLPALDSHLPPPNLLLPPPDLHLPPPNSYLPPSKSLLPKLDSHLPPPNLLIPEPNLLPPPPESLPSPPASLLSSHRSLLPSSQCSNDIGLKTLQDKAIALYHHASSQPSFSPDLISILIHQVSQQDFFPANLAGKLSNMLHPSNNTGNNMGNSIGSNMLDPTRLESMPRMIRMSKDDMVSCTITKLDHITTGLEDEINMMHSEISGSRKVHASNLLTRATQLQAQRLWGQLFESIPNCTARLHSFCRGLPGLAAISPTDWDELFKKSYFEVWIIFSSQLYQDGDFYIRLPNGSRYSIFWMQKFLPKDLVESLVNIANLMENLKLPVLVCKILCAISLLSACEESGCEGAANSMTNMHAYYIDVLTSAITSHYGNTHDKKMLIEIFKLLSLIKHCALRMALIVGNFKIEELPETCLTYLANEDDGTIVPAGSSSLDGDAPFLFTDRTMHRLEELEDLGT